MKPTDIQKMLVIAHMLGARREEQPDTPALDENETFYDHLERCDRCANRPFSLCVTGERLIQIEAEKPQQDS